MAGRCLYKGFVYFMPATSDLKAVASFMPSHTRSMQSPCAFDFTLLCSEAA